MTSSFDVFQCDLVDRFHGKLVSGSEDDVVNVPDLLEQFLDILLQRRLGKIADVPSYFGIGI